MHPVDRNRRGFRSLGRASIFSQVFALGWYRSGALALGPSAGCGFLGASQLRLFLKLNHSPTSICGVISSPASEAVPFQHPLSIDGRLCPGERKDEGTAGVQLAFGTNRSALGLYHVSCNGEAQAGASGLARTRLVHTVEALEDAAEMFGGNPLAKVADAELDRVDRIEALACADDDPAVQLVAGAAVLDAVLDEVAEHLEDGIGVSEDLGVGGFADLENGLLVLDEAAHGLHCVADKDVCTNRGGVKLLLGGLDASPHQQIFRQPGHARGVLQDGRQKLASLRAQGGLVIEQRLDLACYPGPRRARPAGYHGA